MENIFTGIYSLVLSIEFLIIGITMYIDARVTSKKIDKIVGLIMAIISSVFIILCIYTICYSVNKDISINNKKHTVSMITNYKLPDKPHLLE